MSATSVSSVTVRAPRALVETVLADLARPHAHAYERVGFCTGGVLEGGNGRVLVINAYHPVADNRYLHDEEVGARIDGSAIREALQRALSTGESTFHVHHHPGRGRPGLSPTDARELPPLAQSFTRVAPRTPHGVLLLSDDGLAAWTVDGTSGRLTPARRATIVGSGVTSSRIPAARSRAVSPIGDRLARQSFLGEDSDAVLQEACVAVIGLGGGGSHVVQQLAHMGVGRYRLFDADHLTSTNLNRTVTAADADVADRQMKFELARRRILEILPHAEVGGGTFRWQQAPWELAEADVVVGCVDGFVERRDLEAACRRSLQPLVDIGMDLHPNAQHPPRLVGQLIVSAPGLACMWCLGFLREELLAREAERYGMAGDRPQVVWSNGVLASTAVGIVADALTGWRKRPEGATYLSYDGNADTMTVHPRLAFAPKSCAHYPLRNAGPARFERLSP